MRGEGPSVAQLLRQPALGFYRIRLVKNGPWVAAEIALADDIYTVTNAVFGHVWSGTHETLIAETDAALLEGRAFTHPLLRVLLFGQPITPDEYAYLTARRAWATEHARDQPEAAALAPIDLDTMPPLF